MRRWLWWAACGTLVVGLGCSGLPAGSGKGSGSAGKGATAKLMTAKSPLKKGKAGRKPTPAALSAEHRSGEFIAKLKPGAKGLGASSGLLSRASGSDSFNAVLGAVGASQAAMVHAAGKKNPNLSDYLGLERTVRFKSDKSRDIVAKELIKGGQVEWVEPVLKVKAAGAPNDPYWQYQWHLHDLKVDEAWQVTKGKGAIVAVVDTGVSFSEDGYAHLLPGKDFVDGDNDPQDENGHGTHVAGTIAQKTGNGIGTAGVAPEASILPVRVLDANGSGTNDGVAAGIVWAVDNGANIINLSLGSSQNSEVVADAIAYAYDNDVTVVAATGNDGFTDNISYPAALPTPIAVGAVDFKNVVTFYSNQGDEIDIAAPGGDTSVDQSGDGHPDGVLQETHEGPTWGYMFFQGTSMATPHVAGVAALVYANGVHKPDQIRNVLQSSAKDLGNKGRDNTYGFGLVDPVAALGKRSADTGGAIEITDHKVRDLGNGRATISWTTNVASSTMVRGSNGFKKVDDTPVKTHRVTVEGKDGQKASFDIGSSSSGQKAHKTVAVTF